jgi:serine/threonine protein kinase
MGLEPLTGGDPTAVGGFRLTGRLGAGGMGVVYLGFTPGGRPVAVKVVRPELGDDPEFRARFRQEVAAARRVHGLYTAQVVEADPEASPPWLATTYVAGPSLTQAVKGYGPLPARSVLLLVAGVAEALSAIHAAGLVHRDLKPSNVLLAADGPRVIDFGIARAAEATELTRTGVRVGTPQYMAPEQVRGAAVGTAADVWALGALAAFAATGRPPFGEGSEAAVLYRVLHEQPDLGGCPGEVARVIRPCLDADPVARPSPARVLESCGVGAAGRTLDYTQDWLPPTLSADLPGIPGPPAAPAPDLPAASVSAPTVLAGSGLAGSGAPARPRRRRPSAAMLGAGVAAVVVLAGLVVYGLRLLPDSPGGPGPHPSATGSSHGARTSGHDTSGTTSGKGISKSQKDANGASSTQALVDPCLVGTWNVTLQQTTVIIGGEPFQFTGDSGLTKTYSADGVLSEQWSNSLLTAVINGVTWEEIINGSATVPVKTENAKIFRNGSSQVSGTIQLLNGASVNNSQPLTLQQQNGGNSYSCSGNSLRIQSSTDVTEMVRAG